MLMPIMPVEEFNMIWIAYNHNNIEICRHVDVGNLMEEVMFYEEVTGNRCTIKQVEV